MRAVIRRALPGLTIVVTVVALVFAAAADGIGPV
jgi:hypothetical protein